MHAFDRQDLIRALYLERTLIRLPSAGPHHYIVATSQMAAYLLARQVLSGDTTREYLAYLLSLSANQEEADAICLEDVIPRVLEVVNTRGACTVEELCAWLPVLDRQISSSLDGQTAPSKFRLGTRLIPALCAQGVLIPAQPRGSWRSERDTYTTLSEWLPGLDLEPLTPREALGRVLHDYITAYGPVTIGDMIHWLRSARRQQVVSALMAIESSLARVEMGERRGEAWVLRSDLDRLHASPPDERYVRLLPEMDGALMAYSDTSRFLQEEHRDRVHNWVGDALSTVMVDGRIVGLWWSHNKGSRIVVRFFERVDPEAMALAAEEARALGVFLEGHEVDIDVGLFEEDLEGEASPLPLRAPSGR